MFARCRESIAIKSGADEPRRGLRKRILGQESRDLRLSLKQTNHEPDEPGIFLGRSERGEPHLPVEPRLMRRAPTGRTHYISRFPFEFVRQPIDPISAAFDYNFAAILRHHAKKAVPVHDPKWFQVSVDKSERARPWRVRLKRGENEPRIYRQGEEDHRDRAIRRQLPCAIMTIVAAVADRGGHPSPANRCVIDQQQAKRNRKEIEKAVIAGKRDYRLKKNDKSSGNNPGTPGRPDKKWRDDFHRETKCD